MTDKKLNLDEIEARANAANASWNIDLYRTLAQKIELRLAVENFIDGARTDIPALIAEARFLQKTLERIHHRLSTLPKQHSSLQGEVEYVLEAIQNALGEK